MRRSIDRIANNALSVCLAVVLLCGCGKSDPAASPTAATGLNTVPDLYTSAKQPTTEEALAFAKDLEAAFQQDPATVNTLINWDGMITSATANVEVSGDFRRGFAEGVRRATSTETGLAAQIGQHIANGGSMQLVRVHEVDGQQRALFRLILPEAGFNYLDFVLIGTADDVEAIDFHAFMSGERMTETWRRMYLLAISAKNPSMMDRLTGKQSDFIKNASTFSTMTTALRNGDAQLAYDSYDRLPKSLQEEKVSMLIRMQAAGALNEELYIRAIDEFRKTHPNDPCIDFVSLDAFFLRGDYDKAMESLNNLDKSVEDPYLNIMRSNIYIQQGQLVQAREAAEVALKKVPQLSDTYWQLIAVDLAEKKFASVSKWLTKLQDEFHYEMELESVPDYAEYIHSPEYRQWLQSQGK